MSSVPIPVNDQNKTYLPHSPERAELKARLKSMAGERVDMPLIIAGREVQDRQHAAVGDAARSSARARRLARGRAEDVNQAIAAALAAAHDWSSWSLTDRAAVFLRAAELLTTTWRADAQRRDDAGPVQDGLPGGDRFRVRADRLLALQSVTSRRSSTPSSRSARTAMWNQLEYRPLEGFVFAVTPFNFTSIAGNLPTAPALMGNTVVWKPASSAMLCRDYIMRAARRGGPAARRHQLRARRRRADLATSLLDSAATSPACTSPAAPRSSTRMWTTHRRQLGSYRTYPRLVGETGGKDFVFAHPSADAAGARCRARARRLRVSGPEVLGRDPRLRAAVAVDAMYAIGCRDHARDHDGRRRATSATSWARSSTAAFTKISGYLEDARSRTRAIIAGRRRDDGEGGFFIEPTLVETEDPGYRLMCEEIFGPVLTSYRLRMRSGERRWSSSIARRRTR